MRNSEQTITDFAAANAAAHAALDRLRKNNPFGQAPKRQPRGDAFGEQIKSESDNAKHRRKKKAEYANRRAAGLCGQCGTSVEDGYSRCAVHRDADAKRKSGKRAATKAPVPKERLSSIRRGVICAYWERRRTQTGSEVQSVI